MGRNLIFIVIIGALLTAWNFWPDLDIYTGAAWLKEGDYQRAIDAFTRAIESERLADDQLAEAYAGRAEARSALAYATRAGDAAWIEALEDFTAAIKLKPKDPYLYRGRGSVHTYLGAYPEAFADFAAMRPLEGDKPMWSLVRKGGLQRMLGDYEGALESFRAVINAWKPVPLMPPNYHMALTYMKQGRYQLAIDAIDEGMRAQTDYGSAFQFRGCAKANLGRFPEALKDLQHGVDLNRNFRTDRPSYPSTEHNERADREDLKLLQDIVAGRIKPDADRIKRLCFRNWWSLYFDKKRKRSPSLKK